MTEPVVPARPEPAPVGRILMVVAGVILVLVGGAVALAGGFLTWAHATQRDDDGFFSTSTERLDTTATAITTDDVDFDVSPDAADWIGDLATVRIEVDGVTEGTETPAPAFVGIGPADEVATYLEGVAQARIDDVDLDPFRVEYDFTAGTATPAPPADQDFWAAVGGDGQPLEWDVEDGRWVVVIMNDDGSPGVSVDVAVGAKAGWLLPVALVLLIGGFLVALGGTLLLVFGAVGLARHSAVAAPAADRGEAVGIGIAPVRVAGHRDEELSRWLWLVKWFLLIPHFIVLAALWLAVWVVSVIAWFAIVFTGRYPAALFDFTVGVLRWTWRVGFYSYSALGTDEYPPFSLAARPGDPAALEIDRPERLSRGLVWVKSWLLAIPHLLIVAVLTGGAWWGGDGRSRPGLIGLLVLIAGVGLLFTTRYPSGLFDLVVGLNRWVLRVAAYVLLLRDEYPPFRLDQGPDEPVATPDGGGDA